MQTKTGFKAGIETTLCFDTFIFRFQICSFYQKNVSTGDNEANQNTYNPKTGNAQNKVEYISHREDKSEKKNCTIIMYSKRVTIHNQEQNVISRRDILNCQSHI